MSTQNEGIFGDAMLMMAYGIYHMCGGGGGENVPLLFKMKDKRLMFSCSALFVFFCLQQHDSSVRASTVTHSSKIRSVQGGHGTNVT